MCSINARFGALLKHFNADDPGIDVSPLETNWIDDCVAFALKEAQESPHYEKQDKKELPAFRDMQPGFGLR